MIRVIATIVIFIALSCFTGGNKPSLVLKKIHDYELQKQYDKMKDYIYDMKMYKDGNVVFSSQELIIKGIKEHKPLNNFAYTPKTCEIHIKYVDNRIKKGNNYLIYKYLLSNKVTDDYLENIYNNKPEDIWIYEEEFAVLIFVKHQGRLKLLYSSNMTDISIEEKIKNEQNKSDEKK